MIQIEIKFGGNELAKVLHYYGQSPDNDKIVCPFHDDLNPSMKLDFETGSFICFGCQVTGNALTFVKLVEKKDDLESCKIYFKILRSKKVRAITTNYISKPKKENKQALIEAKDFYYGLRTVDWKHDTEDEVVECRAYMKKRGFTAKTLNSCKAKVTYGNSYPIVFPMLDNGTFKGWVCRTDKKRIEQKRKYLYNEGFSRQTTLCGDYTSNIVVVVEGYMDMLKFKQFGLKNVVAILGWKITAQQVEKLKKSGVKLIISALDMDECGNKGTKYLQTMFDVIRYQYPPNVKDAGDLNKQTFEESYNKTKKLIKKWRNSHGFN